MSLALFTCTRHTGDLRLTAHGCSEMWKRENNARIGKGARLEPCFRCPVGAKNSGVALLEKYQPPACASCGRSGMRMVPSAGLCVTCFNWQREEAMGIPRQKRRLLSIAVAGDGGATTYSGYAASFIEAGIRALMAKPGMTHSVKTLAILRDVNEWRAA